MPAAYQSGKIATVSGIYHVKHSKGCLPREVIVLEGQSFPRCPKCAGNASFELKTAAPHISQDKDFSK